MHRIGRARGIIPDDPILGIVAAVNRRTTSGANPDGLFPEQKISVEDAIEAYSLTSAYASFDDISKVRLCLENWRI